jgi:hypothetical protein
MALCGAHSERVRHRGKKIGITHDKGIAASEFIDFDFTPVRADGNDRAGSMGVCQQSTDNRNKKRFLSFQGHEPVEPVRRSRLAA